MSPSTNHLNPTGTSMSRRLKPSATRSIMPLLTMVFPTATLLDHCERFGEQIRYCNREIVVRIKQAVTVADDSMAIGIRVACEGDIVPVFQGDDARHRVHR